MVDDAGLEPATSVARLPKPVEGNDNIPHLVVNTPSPTERSLSKAYGGQV